MPCKWRAGQNGAQVEQWRAYAAAEQTHTHRQILDILVLRVDDIGEVLAVDVLLVHPHSHLVIEFIALEHIATNNLGNRRAPVA